jgi:hypothetical protein
MKCEEMIPNFKFGRMLQEVVVTNNEVLPKYSCGRTGDNHEKCKK